MAVIYKITNILNDRVYVGQTGKKPEERWRQHKYIAKKDGTMVISKAMRRYGVDNFKFEVIEECSTQEINEREIYWIEKLDTYSSGYNSSKGGQAPGAGVIRKKGAVHPDAKSVDCYDLEGKYLCTYDSRGEAAWETARSTSSQSINSCIEGKTFQAFGHRWAWKGKPLKEVNNRVNRKGKVYGIHLESGRKKMWKSQADAAEEIQGNRKANNSLTHALVRNDKPDTTKTQVKGWYLFRDKQIALGEWKPTERHIPTYEESVKGGRMSKGRPQPSKWKAIKGIHIITGEIVEFNHAGEAVEKLKNNFDPISSASSIHGSISRRRTRGIDSISGGYRWFYINEEEDLFESIVNGDLKVSEIIKSSAKTVSIKPKFKRSEETKRKISESMKKVPRTEEWRKNMSKGHKRKIELGQKWGFMNGNYDTTSHAKRKIKAIPVLNPSKYQKTFALSDEELIFDSSSDAAKFFNGKTSNISYAIKSGSTAYGYKWEKIDVNPVKRKVYGIEKDTGQKTMIFESIADAGRCFSNKSRWSGIRNSLKAPGIKTYMKHYWYYV